MDEGERAASSSPLGEHYGGGRGDSQDQWHRFLGLLMKGKAMQQTVGHQPSDWESDG
jgi:hypothetical protein